eukprot:1304736-Rhodomonas_salina.1
MLRQPHDLPRDMEEGVSRFDARLLALQREIEGRMLPGEVPLDEEDGPKDEVLLPPFFLASSPSFLPFIHPSFPSSQRPSSSLQPSLPPPHPPSL